MDVSFYLISKNRITRKRQIKINSKIVFDEVLDLKNKKTFLRKERAVFKDGKERTKLT